MASEVSFPRFWGVLYIEKWSPFFGLVIGSVVTEIVVKDHTFPPPFFIDPFPYLSIFVSSVNFENICHVDQRFSAGSSTFAFFISIPSCLRHGCGRVRGQMWRGARGQLCGVIRKMGDVGSGEGG